ncbi:MAG: hypothetical protein NVSMB9_29820 [Isosphaeraceae bacterium]
MDALRVNPKTKQKRPLYKQRAFEIRDHFVVVAGGGFEPEDSIFFSVVTEVLPSGVEIVSVDLTFVSSEQPTRPKPQRAPRIKVDARTRFIINSFARVNLEVG